MNVDEELTSGAVEDRGVAAESVPSTDKGFSVVTGFDGGEACLRLVAADPEAKSPLFVFELVFVWSRDRLDTFCLSSADPSVNPLECFEGFGVSVVFGVSATIDTTRGASSLVLPLLGFNLMGSALNAEVVSFVEELFPLFSRAEPAALP